MVPNWAFGYIKVKGKNSKDVENFCKLFIFEDEIGEKGKKQEKYFARSFIQEDWKDFKKKHLRGNIAEFFVDFAWSCWSCIFEGYPNNKECVTLSWAMKKYNVEVEIETEESGNCFEEKVTTKNKKPIYQAMEMPEYTCQKCGNTQPIVSSYTSQDLENVECYKCGTYGRWEDEFKKMVREKIEDINKRKKLKIKNEKD